MYKVEKLVAFTGHRSEKLPQSPEIQEKLENSVRLETLKAIQSGHNTFFTGMSYGFDLLASAVVLEVKKDHAVNLVAAVPFYGQEKNWSASNIREYHRILSLCDDIKVGYDCYRSGVYHERNRFMVDNSQLVIAYSNGTGGTQYTVNYAQSRGVPVINLFKGQ